MLRGKVWCYFLFGLLIALTACGAPVTPTIGDEGRAPSGSVAVGQLAGAAVPAPPLNTPAGAESVQQFQGTGSQVSPSASFIAGLATFRLTHSGGRNFIVDLVDADARRVATLISEIGAVDGGTVAHLPADGDYTLNVIADGAWTIVVGQPTEAELAAAPPLPQTFGGRGADYFPFSAERGGNLHLKLAYKGKRDFVVRVVDTQGRLIDMPANGRGALAGAKNVDLPAAGVYFLVVEAADDWSIELRPQFR